MQALKKYFENIISTSMPMAARTVALGSVPAAAALCARRLLMAAIMPAYQRPMRTSSATATRAASANQPTACCPKGITISAVSSGPTALPPLPPTWKIDCARLLRPPEAIGATRDASGWNTDEPHPMSATDSSMGAKPGAKASATSPKRVKHMPAASE